MIDHPVRYEELMAYALGQGDNARIAAHVADCPDCQSTAARFIAARATVAADARFEPSADALSRVLGLMSRRTATATSASPVDLLRRVFASLSFDSRRAYAAAGLRGDSDAYLLSYVADTATLDLEIEPPQSAGDGPWRLTGQLDIPGLTHPADIAAASDDRTQVTTSSDQNGVFSIDLLAGRYDLQVRVDDTVILFPEVEVG